MGLLGSWPSPLLLAYDGECSLCCKSADWLRVRDHQGLIHLFPLQHPELVKMAPELAGRALHGELHGLDLGTRQVWTGSALLAPLARRLPRWRWASPLLALPGIAPTLAWLWLKAAERRYRRTHR